MFYTSNDVLGLDRDYSGDYVIFNGERYKVEDESDWFAIDGWNGVLLVKAPLNNVAT